MVQSLHESNAHKLHLAVDFDVTDMQRAGLINDLIHLNSVNNDEQLTELINELCTE